MEQVLDSFSEEQYSMLMVRSSLLRSTCFDEDICKPISDQMFVSKEEIFLSYTYESE